MDNQSIVDHVLYATLDPAVDDGHHPAMTTLLYRVCNQDINKFREASRIIELFVKEAVKRTQLTDSRTK